MMPRNEARVVAGQGAELVVPAQEARVVVERMLG